MLKIFALLLLVITAACNNNENAAAENNGITADTAKAAKPSFQWAAEEEHEFMAGCVDNAKGKLGDTAAYSYCHCILAQVKQTYPNMDSASAILMDTSAVIQYAKNCK
jgi:hypothetical protein